MFHAEFKLTWPDGLSVRVAVDAPSPESDVPVRYTGTVSRLPAGAPENYDVACLRIWTRALAYKQGCQFEDLSSGQFDSWAL